MIVRGYWYMVEILLKALGFILIIIVGATLRAKGKCTREHGKFLSFVVLNVTLPCSILSSAKNMELTPIMLAMLFIGLGANLVTNAVGFLTSKGDTPVNRGITMINMSGYNIGAFTMPFVQSFFDPAYLMYMCMFDMGNSFMCLGGTFSIAGTVASSEHKPSLGMIVRRLFSSVPFCTYLVLLVLALFDLSVPQAILTVTEPAARANAFLAMFVIGLLLELKLDLSQIKMIRKILLCRYAISIAAVLLIYTLLPVASIVKKMLAMAFFAPVSAAAPVFSARLGSDSPVPAAVNSISIIVSIAAITSIVLFA